MKKVLLIGDSIRKGYDKYTRDKLSKVAEVYFPSVNCMYAVNVLRHIDQWSEELGLDKNEVDVVHWNAGLWDCLNLADGEPLTPVEVYAAYIGRIQKAIETHFPNARSVFATSTSISEKMWKWENKARYNWQIEQYNAAALKALEGYDVRINDLYALVSPLPDSYHSDATHFYTPESTALIGDRVIEHILAALDLDASALTRANGDYTPDKIIGI